MIPKENFLDQFEIKTRLDTLFKRKTKTVVRVENGKRVEIEFAIDEFESSSEGNKTEEKKLTEMSGISDFSISMEEINRELENSSFKLIDNNETIDPKLGEPSE